MKVKDVLDLFCLQFFDATGIKTVLAPNAIKEDQPVAKVFPLDITFDTVTYGDVKNGAPLTIKVRLTLEARIESAGKGLELALDAAMATGRYLADKQLRLLDADGETPLAQTRIIVAAKGENESFLEDPEKPSAAWLQDEYRISITVPRDLVTT